MKSTKLLIGFVTIVVIVIINVTTLLPKSAQADNYCYGRIWFYCEPTGQLLIMCKCWGGPICYASWQDLCEVPE